MKSVKGAVGTEAGHALLELLEDGGGAGVLWGEGEEERDLLDGAGIAEVVAEDEVGVVSVPAGGGEGEDDGVAVPGEGAGEPVVGGGVVGEEEGALGVVFVAGPVVGDEGRVEVGAGVGEADVFEGVGPA